VQLDLADQTSVKSFYDYIKNKEFNAILYMIGETSLSDSNKEKYLSTNLVSTVSILENLRNSLNKKDKSIFIYMASRSAIYPSFDLYYSIVKAGLAAAIRSLSLGLLKNQKMLSIAPGLIVGSNMYQSMPDDVKKSHHVRSDNSLLDLENLASEVFKIIDCQEDFENGSLIEVGPKYK
jgi:short-subunit dehydrogenase